MADTEVVLTALGILAIRNRNVGDRKIKLAIGGGAPEEAMSTMGLRVRRNADAEAPTAPPNNRAFKTSDAFCLISGDEILLMVEGMSTTAVQEYFRRLLQAAGQPAGHAAFEFRPVGDQEQQEVLAAEGVKELRLSGTAYQAQAELARQEYGDSAQGIISSLWEETKERFRSLLSEQVSDERELQVLAEHWADLNITTTIKASGGSRAEPVILEVMQNAGLDLIEERPENVQVTLVTRQGTVMAGSSLVLGKYVNLVRQNGRNDLSYFDVWTSLETYLVELIDGGRWGG